jgi:hypothetical protein
MTEKAQCFTRTFWTVKHGILHGKYGQWAVNVCFRLSGMFLCGNRF